MKTMKYHNINKIFILSFITAIILISIYFSWMPVFHSNSWSGHDNLVHLNRALSTSLSIENGQFPAIYDVTYKNYPGYSINIFYPPLTNYIITAIYYMVGDFNLTTKLVSIFIFIAITLSSSFVLFKTNKSLPLSILYSLCFSCSIYIVDNIFIRTSFPETMALSAIPLFFYGLFSTSKKKSIIFLTISNFIFITTNIPATLCSGIVFLIYYAINRRCLLNYFISSVLSLIISSWYVIPLVYSISGESFTILSRNWFPTMTQLSINAYDFIFGEIIKTGPLTGMALGIGLPTITAFIYSLLRNEKTENNEPMTLFVILAIICSGANYNSLPSIFEPLSKIQFSWRLVPFALFLMIFYTYKTNKIKAGGVAAILFLTSLMNTSITVNKTSSTDITYDSVALASYQDYVLKNASVVPTGKDGVSCKDKTDNIIYSLSPSGLPIYKIHTLEMVSCVIPFMAYKSLEIKGGNNFKRNGYFEVNLPIGDSIIEVKITDKFNVLLWASILLSIFSVSIFTWMIIRLSRQYENT